MVESCAGINKERTRKGRAGTWVGTGECPFPALCEIRQRSPGGNGKESEKVEVTNRESSTSAEGKYLHMYI